MIRRKLALRSRPVLDSWIITVIIVEVADQETIQTDEACRPGDGLTHRLLHAAAEVFAEKGYERAGVAEIARRAGVTTGAIYSRYGGKAELLLEAVDHHVPDSIDNILNLNADLADRLRRRVEDVDRRLGKLADEATTEGLFDPGLDEQSVVRLAHAIGFGMLLTRSMGLELPAAENWHEVINRVITGLGAPPAGEAMTSGDPS